MIGEIDSKGEQEITKKVNEKEKTTEKAIRKKQIENEADKVMSSKELMSRKEVMAFREEMRMREEKVSYREKEVSYREEEVN
jgi:hypothetical protein